jgi:hypothetical protein
MVMSLLNLRYESNRLSFNVGLILEIMTALLIAFAAMLVLVHLAAEVGVAPATDLEFLAIAYS